MSEIEWKQRLMRNCTKEELVDFFLKNQYRIFCVVDDLDYEVENYILECKWTKLTNEITQLIDDMDNDKSIPDKIKLHERIMLLNDRRFKIDDKKENLRNTKRQACG